MSIRKSIITAVALVAAASACHAGRLATTPSDYEKDESTSAETETESLDLSKLKSGTSFVFSIDEDFPETISGHEVLSSFLPEDVELEWTGKKLKAPKSGKIKYSKKEEDFVDARDSDNPSGLSAKLKKSKGTVSGSFKIYVAKSKKKVKSYKAKFSGKVGESMDIVLKKKVIATATMQVQDAVEDEDDEQDTAKQTATAQ